MLHELLDDLRVIYEDHHAGVQIMAVAHDASEEKKKKKKKKNCLIGGTQTHHHHHPWWISDNPLHDT